MPVRTKKKEDFGKEGKNYHLTLEEIKEYYHPKHINATEIKSQRVGTTITIDCDRITIIGEVNKNYPKPDNVS